MRFTLPRCLFSSKASISPNSILVAPLAEGFDVTLPPGLNSADFDLKYINRVKIPNVNKRQIQRRAEYSSQNEALRHSLNVRRNSLKQHLLYQFALTTCLNLNADQSSSFVLLDIGCGSLLPFGGEVISSSSAFKLGLDQIVEPKDELNFIRCSLVNSRLPLRDSSVDYLVSISFFQWITASENQRIVDLFCRECLRVLSTKYGAGIIQFYPANENDLNSLCIALVREDLRIKGCRIFARPIDNRGVKIFVYFTRG